MTDDWTEDDLAEDDDELEGPPPIPPELMSVYEKGPFKTCSYCSADLAAGLPHVVEKVFRGTETIVEFALCLGCLESIRHDFSEESLAMMDRYVAERRPRAEPECCLGCGRHREELSAYQLAGLCCAGYLMTPEVMTICETCAESTQSRLSQKTRDRLDDFRRDVLDLFPDGLALEPLVL
jgi:hypothetical protein